MERCVGYVAICSRELNKSVSEWFGVFIMNPDEISCWPHKPPIAFPPISQIRFVSKMPKFFNKLQENRVLFPELELFLQFYK